MKNCLWLSLAFAVVLGFAADQTFARGGGGRGGARGGASGARSFSSSSRGTGEGRQASGERNPGERNPAERSSNVRNNVSDRAGAASNARPFTNGWYANHPGAWRYARPWGVAGYGAAAAWLGLNDSTVYTSDNAVDDEVTGDTETDDDQADDDNSSTSTDQFLSLGVFSLAQPNEKEATAMVQLAIAKDGTVRGSYYDILTNQDQNIQGVVDKVTQRVIWTVGDNGQVRFETELSQLTQRKGKVTLQFNNGQAKSWTLARYENADAAGK